MYRIVVNNETVAIVETPRYIKVNPHNPGVYVQAKNRQDAQGIAVNGNPYNIDGHIEIAGKPTAYLFEDDAGKFIEAVANETNQQIVGGASNIAEKNYPVGEYLICENKLCVVTKAIARTEKIKIGHNVKETSIMEELINKTKVVSKEKEDE